MSTTARKIAAWSINADAHSLIHSSSFLPVLVGEEEEEEGVNLEELENRQLAFADIFAEGRDEEREGERGSWCGTGVPGLPMCLPARPWPWRGAQDRTGQDAEPCQVQLMVSLLRPKNSGCPVPSPPASAGTWRCRGRPGEQDAAGSPPTQPLHTAQHVHRRLWLPGSLLSLLLGTVAISESWGHVGDPVGP